MTSSFPMSNGMATWPRQPPSLLPVLDDSSGYGGWSFCCSAFGTRSSLKRRRRHDVLVQDMNGERHNVIKPCSSRTELRMRGQPPGAVTVLIVFSLLRIFRRMYNRETSSPGKELLHLAIESCSNSSQSTHHQANVQRIMTHQTLQV